MYYRKQPIKVYSSISPHATWLKTKLSRSGGCHPADLNKLPNSPLLNPTPNPARLHRNSLRLLSISPSSASELPPADSPPSKAFLSAIPFSLGRGMAFVVGQHLSPDHKSLLTELVRRYTRLQVHEVEDGMEVMPNRVYIIPPNHHMALLAGKLHFSRCQASADHASLSISSSAPWPPTSRSGLSALSCLEQAATAAWAFAPSRPKAEWPWPNLPRPRNSTACRAAPSPQD